MNAAAVRLDASERWRGADAPIGRASQTMALIALASLAGHLLVVGTAVVTTRSFSAPAQEILVEVVQEMPKSAPEERKAPEPAKSSDLKPVMEAAKETAKTLPPTEPTKPQPPASIAAAPERAAEAEEQKLASLQKELDALRAEQASLQAERAAADASPTLAPLRDSGLGPLPSSFQAVALPAANDGAGEAVSYQEIVFSALAKAKGFGRTKGLPGSAGVRFSLDAEGRLVAVELVHGSGVPSLDAEALDIVRRAVFPPPPQGAQRSFFANVNFVTGAQ